MDISIVKAEIEKQTGVPASLLTGATADENIAQAKALIAFKKEFEEEQPKAPEEKFAEWLSNKFTVQTAKFE